MIPHIDYIKVNPRIDESLKMPNISVLNNDNSDYLKKIYADFLPYASYEYHTANTDAVNTVSAVNAINYITKIFERIGQKQCHNNIADTAALYSDIYQPEYSVYQSRGGRYTEIIVDDGKITVFYPVIYCETDSEPCSLWAIVRGIPHRMRFSPMNNNGRKGLYMFPEYLYRASDNKLSAEVERAFEYIAVLGDVASAHFYAGKDDKVYSKEIFSSDSTAINNLNLINLN